MKVENAPFTQANSEPTKTSLSISRDEDAPDNPYAIRSLKFLLL
jgi:hypothetical protein